MSVLALEGVRVVLGGTPALDGLDWTVGEGERWAVLGPNGAGKSTLGRLSAAFTLPSRGTVRLLGERFGRVDLRDLRRRVGYTGAPLARLLRPELTALQTVVTGRPQVTAIHRQVFSPEEWDRAGGLLSTWDVGALADRLVADLSEGERQRVLLGRAVMGDPELLVLDEPTAGLDMGGRERLLTSLAALDTGARLRAIVLVTHHVEEIPPGFTHALLLRAGRAVAAGPIADTLTARTLQACFGLPFSLSHREGRWSAQATGR